MSLILIGLNHKSAPLSVREKLAHLCEEPIPGVDGHKLEAVAVYTCNRVEIYFAGSVTKARKSFRELLETKGLKYDDLTDHLYEKFDEEVPTHLFAVSSGLDSMVLGENQILHQIKESYRHCAGLGYVSRNLHRLFQKALEVGKRVRTETGISENSVSIASTAVNLAKRIFGPLNDSVALVVGAGEMASLVAVHLRENTVKNMLFTNRTLSSAEELAKKYGGEAVKAEELEELLVRSDIVISSTSAPSSIINRAQMQKAMYRRAGRPVFIIDIAVPRDFCPDCGKIANLFLYDIDDLQNVVNENLSQRQVEAAKAQKIVEHEADEFMAALQTNSVAPLIRSLTEEAEHIRSSELTSFFDEHPEINDEIKASFEHSTRILMSRWLHQQIMGLKTNGTTEGNLLAKLRQVLGGELGSGKNNCKITSLSRKRKIA